MSSRGIILYRFHIRMAEAAKSGYMWSKLVAVLNDGCGGSLMWLMEVVYAGKLVVLVTKKPELQLQDYIDIFKSLASYGILEESFDYEEVIE